MKVVLVAAVLAAACVLECAAVHPLLPRVIPGCPYTGYDGPKPGEGRRSPPVPPIAPIVPQRVSLHDSLAAATRDFLNDAGKRQWYLRGATAGDASACVGTYGLYSTEPNRVRTECMVYNHTADTMLNRVFLFNRVRIGVTGTVTRQQRATMTAIVQKMAFFYNQAIDAEFVDIIDDAVFGLKAGFYDTYVTTPGVPDTDFVCAFENGMGFVTKWSFFPDE